MTNQERLGSVRRVTKETEITVHWQLDGQGDAKVATGVGFFDHMLAALAKHGSFDLTVACQGDLQVDSHHTIEDVGICLGEALRQALKQSPGFQRFGTAVIPMDDAVVEVALDLSDRPYLGYHLQLPGGACGQFPAELLEEFLRALANHAGLTLHVFQRSGHNLHHLIEACFKALAVALRQAVTVDRRMQGTRSTKGEVEFREDGQQ